ncbi:sensor histidine kinase [Neobacillus niacini]|uniref:sensor histidine kinase n=1 Tax=Neobacillus niacini TaxID=86668 RepID=UPI002FFE4FF8
MFIFNKFNSLKIYPKLVLTFLLVLSPIYIIGLMMNESGAQHVKEEIAHSLDSRVNLYMELLDSDFNRTMELMKEYINDEDLLDLSTSAEIMSELEKNKAILRLKQRLNILKGSSKFVENAFVMIPLIDRTVSSNVDAITELDREEFDSLKKLKNLYESPFIQMGDQIFISIPYPDPSISKEQTFVLAVEVSRPQLASALKSFTDSGGAAVLDGRNIPSIVAEDLKGEGQQLFLQEMKDIGNANFTSIRNVKIGDKFYMVAHKESERLDIRMSMFVPSTEINNSLQDYQRWLLLLSIASLALIMIFSYLIFRMIHQPLKNLIQNFRNIEKGNFDIVLKYPLNDEFGYLYDQFNSTVHQLDILVHEVYEQQYRASLSELRHLQSQINPHFLYNTYFILYRMAKLRDHENIILLANYLGEYFQFITRDGADEIPFGKEAKHAKNYLDIQTMRFANRIRVHFDKIPEGALPIIVPRLILQPIIENAYEHALEKKPKDAWINVNTKLKENYLIVTVEDNGGELTNEKIVELNTMLQNPKEVAESTGIINVHRRIQIKYGGKGGITLSMNEHNGLKVEIIIPLEGN